MTVVEGTALDAAKAPIPFARIRITLITGTADLPGYTADGELIAPHTVKTDETGAWSVDLPPTSSITPSETHFEFWESGGVSTAQIPATGGPYQLKDILVTPPPTPSAPGITGVQVAVGGAVEGSRPQFNLIAGANVVITGEDDPGNDRVDLTISAASGSGIPATTVQPGTSYGVASAVGTDTSYAREDHQHGTPTLTSTAPATTEGIGQSAAVGTATTPARADHVHPLAAAGVPGASAVGDTAAAGSATTFAASDHVHGRESFGAVTALSAFNTASSNGAAATASRSDHQHGAPALPAASTGAPGIVQLDGAATDIQALGTQAAGAIGKAADAGHVHPATGLVLASQLPLAVANGGTGAATAPAALANLGAVASGVCDMYGLGLCTVERLTDSGYSSTQTAGDLVLFLVNAPKSATISTLGIQVTGAGVTGSGVNALALYTEAGTLIDQTGDMTADMSLVKFAEGALSASHQITAGTNYWLAVLTHFSGTQPKFAATGTTQSSNIPPLNGHYTAIFKSGQVSFPAAFTPSAYTLNSGNYVAYAR